MQPAVYRRLHVLETVDALLMGTAPHAMHKLVCHTKLVAVWWIFPKKTADIEE